MPAHPAQRLARHVGAIQLERQRINPQPLALGLRHCRKDAIEMRLVQTRALENQRVLKLAVAEELQQSSRRDNIA